MRNLIIALAAAVLLTGCQPVPPPQPAPGPTPGPTPARPLVQRLQQLVRQYLPSTTAAERQAVATHYLTLAAELDSLRDPLSPSKLKRPSDAPRELGRRLQTQLGPRWAVWSPFADAVAAELSRAEAAGEIPRSVYGVAEAFDAVAEALGFIREPRGPPRLELARAQPPDSAPQAPAAGKRDLAPPPEIAAVAITVPESNDIRNFVAPVRSVMAHRPEGFEAEAAAEDPPLTPEQLEQAYSRGFVGVFLDDEQSPDWAREAARAGEDYFDATAGDQALFSDAFPSAWFGSGKDKHAVYWNFALRFDGDPTPVFKIQQTTGNCVAASIGDVSLTHCLGVALFLYERPFEWRGCGSSVFYSWRGHCGQGANLGTIAAAHQRHGWAARTVYGSIDLRDTRADQSIGQSNCRSPGSSLASLWSETAKTPVGKVARFDGGLDELCDLLFAGGSLNTGGRITASRDGRPVSRQAGVGPHAQSIIGFESRPSVLQRLGQREPVFFFSQTWGPVQYIQSGWLAEEWGQMPQGCFILPWSVVRQMLGGSYAYWPDLTGFEPAQIDWRLAHASANRPTPAGRAGRDAGCRACGDPVVERRPGPAAGSAGPGSRTANRAADSAHLAIGA